MKRTSESEEAGFPVKLRRAEADAPSLLFGNDSFSISQSTFRTNTRTILSERTFTFA